MRTLVQVCRVINPFALYNTPYAAATWYQVLVFCSKRPFELELVDSRIQSG